VISTHRGQPSRSWVDRARGVASRLIDIEANVIRTILGLQHAKVRLVGIFPLSCRSGFAGRAFAHDSSKPHEQDAWCWICVARAFNIVHVIWDGASIKLRKVSWLNIMDLVKR